MNGKFIIDPGDIQWLLPMPTSVGQLAHAISEPETDINKVIRIIEFDQALTANVLRWANSAWSGSKVVIETVRESVIRLGTGTILKLAVGHGLSANMQNCQYLESGEETLWRHSIAAALASESMRKFTEVSVPPTAFTAALIHDIGKLLLARFLDDSQKERIRKLVQNEHLDPLDAERCVLGTDHARVGGEIAWFWKFPEELARSVENHHALNSEPDILLDTVIVGNAVAHLLSPTPVTNPGDTKIPARVVQRMGLSSSKLQLVCQLVKENLEETLKTWEG